MKLTTGGESHGRALSGIIEGLPSNMKIDLGKIDESLALRQGGYGRGERQKIEKDKITILSGVRGGLTLGSPLSFIIENKDYENWEKYMSPEGPLEDGRRVTAVRPGHADLTGLKKFGHSDARNVLERASARETAIRVAAGAVAAQYLAPLGVEVYGRVVSVGGVDDDGKYSYSDFGRVKINRLFMIDEKKSEEAIKLIDGAKAAGDTLGGVIEIRVRGLKPGFGSCMQYDKKLDARLSGALMSVQAIKGVEFGLGFEAARLPGSAVHDEIFYDGGRFYRKTNNAGGIEGGMSNGEEIVIRLAMKPIPTLMKGLSTVDYETKKEMRAAGERSDVCAVCAAEVIAESVTAFTVADVVSERVGGDTYPEVLRRYEDLEN
ncbi:MAG: chorismate synthase [Clostridia bacterium]|nr:chorismate synthase [Clostridia bacterium]